MNILILEDEQPAYDKLLICLNSYFQRNFVHDRVGSNTEAKKLLLRNNYNFILSDVRLLDGISFDLFNEIKTDIPIIFCSAHDEFLFEAFNTNGIAYILKPYTQQDFDKAMNKFHKLCRTGDYIKTKSKVMLELKSVLHTEQKKFKKRFVIKNTQEIVLLETEDISLIQASGDKCIVIDYKGNHFTIPSSLTNILEQLNPMCFFKINRSEIVNIKHITQLKSHTKNRLFITVKGINIKLLTSSSSTSTFRKWIEG